MKLRGFDPDTIENERSRLERFEAGLGLIPIITAAFNGVTLGDGVGLTHAQGLDDYADEATCARYRDSDEKEDWTRISFESLCHCNSSLSFFDAEGMRFHLPAYLVADLRKEYGYGMAFCLSHRYPGSDDRFSLLSTEQRIAVRLFLLHILNDPDYEFDRPHLKRSLDEYWVLPVESPTQPKGEQVSAPNDR